MLVARITGGLANQIYEYMTAYALSVKMGVELRLDISETALQFRGYLLDSLNIPDYKKIFYDYNPGNIGPDLYVHEEILKNYIVCIHPLYARANGLYEDISEKIIVTDDLDRIEGLISAGKDVYLYGSFDERALYREEPYWSELQKQLTMIEFPTIYNKFRELIKDRNAVAIHIRRGDYLLADNIRIPSKEYYRSSIEWFRNKLIDPVFYVFTDDHAWAGEVLGYAEDIKYSSGIGGMDIDICEMFCISICKYKILSYYSGYSNLADSLNYTDSNITIRSYDAGDSNVSFFKRTELDIRQFIKHIIKNYKNRNQNVSYQPYISEKSKNMLASVYESKMITSVRDNESLLEVFSISDEKSNANYILDIIDSIGLNYVAIEQSRLNKLYRKKMIALVNLKRYEEAWLLVHKIRFAVEDEVFLNAISECCVGLGKESEAEFEACRLQADRETRNYIILPGSRFVDPSVRLYGVIYAGVLLRQRGNRVCYVFEKHKVYDKYLKLYSQLTDADKTVYGCTQISVDELESNITNIICKDMSNVVIFEDEMSVDKFKKLVYKGMDRSIADKITYINYDDEKEREADSDIIVVDKRMNYADLYSFQERYFEYVRRIDI